jgi:hypothetical protein
MRQRDGPGDRMIKKKVENKDKKREEDELIMGTVIDSLSRVHSVEGEDVDQRVELESTKYKPVNRQ